MRQFAPLHIISGYSFLKSGLTMKKIAKVLESEDYFALGLSDDAVLYGVPEFVNILKAANKKYLIGMNVVIEETNLSLYAISEEGYHSLINISLAIQKQEFDLKYLFNHHTGLVAIIETNHGAFKDKFNENSENLQAFAKYLIDFSKIFNSDFYLGIEVTSKEEIDYAKKVREFTNNFSYECIAFPRIKYLKKDDAIVMNIVTAIANNETIEEKEAVGQEYFYSINNYAKIYTPQEMDNTIKLVERSTFDFALKRGEMLHYSKGDSNLELKELAYTALKKKGLDDKEEYISRLDYELKVISDMGYSDYFLLVGDYVSYAKSHDILVGAGRGSAAGSLVSYLLNITEVDPLKYGLQFERFLNPYRKTMPDIDVDFMDTRRDEAIEYLRNKYGHDKVANIVAFQTIASRQSIRDIGRVYQIPERHVVLLTKLLTNPKYTLGQSYKYLEEFKKIVDSDDYFKQIISLAGKIEGLPRQSGLHAAGVILNNDPIDQAMPVSIDFNDNYISQYEGVYLEEQGFLKMDFLGLRNLTAVARCLDLIKLHHPDFNMKFEDIPYEEKEIFELISSLRTMGVFQLESSGMKRAIKILKPKEFNDVVALLALFRPGPMDSIKDYASRKNDNVPFRYVSDDLKDILKETYGIIVYQEQINQIATKMAGFSLGEADIFRRAVSKKDKAKIMASEKDFIEGAIKNGHSEKVAKDVFDHILRFANYGFNKSHSVVYSILACRMAWLKVHYPLEFYSSILETSASTSDTKFSDYVNEMKSLGIKILSPDINKSGKNFIVSENALVFPLSSISGINDQMVSHILYEREENGPFKSYFDFAGRMYPYKLTETQLIKLVNSGALDVLYPSRASMRASAKSAIQFAELTHKEDGQLSIGIASMLEPAMNEEHDIPLDNLDLEFESIGILLSANPLTYKKDLLAANNVISILDAKEQKNSTIAGILKNIKIIHTKKGETMAFIKIVDESAEMEITIFPKLYQECLGLLQKNNILLVEGYMDSRSEEEMFIADSVKLLEE